MTDSTPCLHLPLLLENQAQKHVTLNEALLMLDALVQLRVISRSIPMQPSAPIDGDRYIVPSGAMGETWEAQSIRSPARSRAMR